MTRAPKIQDQPTSNDDVGKRVKKRLGLEG
jgi:hypothetical protein